MMEASKSRHGCLTAFLVFMIIANSVTAIIYLFGSDAISRALPDAPGWVFLVLAVFSVFNLACAIALFKWKKWGFWGFCLSGGFALVINVSIGLGVGRSLSGLIGIAILYGVLHIGKENKGWPQLNG